MGRYGPGGIMERGSIHLGLESFWRVIGDGTEEDRLTPVEVKGLSGIVDISAGHYKSMALDSSGYPWVWGMDTPGHVGDGTACKTPTKLVSSTYYL